MREIRTYGSEGGGPQFNAVFLPLSNLPALLTPPAASAFREARNGRQSERPTGNIRTTVSPFRPLVNTLVPVDLKSEVIQEDFLALPPGVDFLRNEADFV